MGNPTPVYSPAEDPMAKKSAKPKTKEAPAQTESAEGAETNAHGRGLPTSKSDAVRMAIAAGFDGPQVGANYIRSQFGLDVSPEHFSAVKSADMKKVLTEKPKGKPGRKKKVAVEDGQAPPPKVTPSCDDDLLDALKSLKGLVNTHGVDKVKQMVDLLG